MKRIGLSIPCGNLSPLAQAELISQAESIGYTDVWSSEVAGTDGLGLLAAAAPRTDSIRLGTAVLPIFTRGPALLAMSIATMASLLPSRFVAGIGTSSSVIVEDWNDGAFRRPLKRMEDTIGFLRRCMRGERVDEHFDSFAIRGFRLAAVPDEPPPLMVAALRERMLRLGGQTADGVILNWLSPSDVAKVRRVVHEEGQEKEIVARLFVIPSDDRAIVRRIAAQNIAAYLNVPIYARYQEWLGRAADLAEVWARWRAGDRKGAVEAVSDKLIDDLFIHGSHEQCEQRIVDYVASGVDTPVLALLTPDEEDVQAHVRGIARHYLDGRRSLHTAG